MFLESISRRSSASFVVSRLFRILLLKALQIHVENLPRGTRPWLSALDDPNIGDALRLIHAQPELGWTVSDLAHRVALSRSAFFARFADLVGKPPLEYLTDCRMQKASYLLRTSSADLKEVARQVGYESASAFSKAFSRWSGSAPSLYRKSNQASPGVPINELGRRVAEGPV